MNSLLRRGLSVLAALTVTVLTTIAALTAATSGSEAATQPVLGSPGYLAPNATGFGTAHPRSFYNGGDPSGNVTGLIWRHWGQAQAKAKGLTPIFKPGGGYYRNPGHIKLRASGLGTCPDGTYAYTHLDFKVSRTPNGPVEGQWQPWADSGNICE